MTEKEKRILLILHLLWKADALSREETKRYHELMTKFYSQEA